MSKRNFKGLIPLIADQKYREFIQRLYLVINEYQELKASTPRIIPFIAFKLSEEKEDELNIYFHLAPNSRRLIYTLKFTNSFNKKNAYLLMMAFLQRVKEFLSIYELSLNPISDISLSSSYYSYFCLNENIADIRAIQTVENCRLENSEIETKNSQMMMEDFLRK